MNEVNKKIKNYVDVLFADVPRSKKAAELKEEILSNMDARFRDCMAQGMSENQAYSSSVASMGDIDEMLSQVMPDADFRKQANYYRTRNARNLAIGVGMYIIGAAALIGMSVFMRGNGPIIGLITLLVLAAVATGLIIYSHSSTPGEFKDYNEMGEKEDPVYLTPAGKTFKSVISIYWSVITAVYLLVSFLTGRWDITWLIWPVSGILAGIAKTVYELRSNDNEK